MTHILFAHSFFQNLDPKQRVIGEPYPPLGTLIAAELARQHGFKVSLFDAMLSEHPDHFEEILKSSAFTWVVFFEDNFNWRSKMCLLEMRVACFRMLEFCKEAGTRSIVIGSDATDNPDLYLRHGAEFVIAGEAEFQLMDLLLHREPGPGVFYLTGQTTVGQPPAKPVRDPSKFPSPAWDLVDVSAYRNAWREKKGYFSLNMVTTRGCPYRCNWCAKPIHGRQYTLRPAVEVAEEMALHKFQHHADHIWFADDIFGLKRSWIETFAKEVQRLNAALPYQIQVRADLISPEFAENLKASGCQTAWMGVESGSQRILDAMHKDLRIDHIHQAVSILDQVGIECCFFLQFGYPGETIEDIRKTWELIRQTKPTAIGISVAYPLPNTPFHAMVESQLTEQKNWQFTNDMKPIFKATYPSNFYPVLYHYFHDLFYDLKHNPRGFDRMKHLWKHAITKRRLKAFKIKGIPF